MEFESVIITNFKALKKYEYNPEHKIAVLCAPNGTGKTSFLEAVRFGLTGDTPDNCINDSADEATVSIALKSGLVFSRTKHITKPTKIRVAGKSTTAKNLELLLSDETGIGKDAMRITTSQDILSAMKPDELGSFLMSYVPEEVDFDTVVKYIPDITPQEKNELATYLPAMPIKFGLDTVEDAYQRIFESRSFAKKSKENRDAQINAVATEPPVRPLREVLEEEADILCKEGAQTAAKAAIELYESAVKSRERAEENLRMLQSEIDAITAKKPNDEVLKTITEKKAECNKRIADANSMLAMINSNIDLFSNTVANLGKPVCPISERLVCTTDKSAVREELEELIQANKDGASIQTEIIKKAEVELNDLRSQERMWNDNAKAYAQKTALVNRYAVEKKNLPVIPVRPAVIDATTNFTLRKAELKEEKSYCEIYEKNQKMIRESAALKEKYDILNSLSDYSPDRDRSLYGKAYAQDRGNLPAGGE